MVIHVFLKLFKNRIISYKLIKFLYLTMKLRDLGIALLTILVMKNVDGYKPVAIIHGLLDISTTMDYLADYIRQVHPGTVVKILNILHGYESLQPLWRQVNKFSHLLSQFMNVTEEGIHLIGYSQGGLIARGILSSLKHNVDTFISLSSPQMGQYGDTDYLRYLFPNYVKANIYKLFYSHIGQKISIGNYWKDPHHIDLYQNYSAYLAVLNNETHNAESNAFKNNFLRLNNLILIGGPDDGVITPWQSSHFGFFDSNENITEMKKQQVFLKDSFGLQTLYKRQAITTYVVPGIGHLDWHRNTTIFDSYILPHLT